MAKRVELLYLDNTLGQWTNARYRYWKTALDPDDWASVATAQGTDINPITALHITDTVGNPRKAQVTLVNRPRDLGSSTENERKGRFTGVFTDFQSVRLRDGETGTILLAGKIYNVDEKFDFQYGTSIVLDIRDPIQELIDTRTAHWPDIDQTGNATTRSSMIQTMIAGNRNYTYSSLITTDGAAAQGSKVKTSLRPVDSTGRREFKGNKSVLAEISNMAAEDPHSIEIDETVWVAQLAEALDNTETGVDIDEFKLGYANAGQAFSAGDHFKIDNEIMRVVSISTDTLTVVRGVLGSTADSHGDNTLIYRNPGAAKFGFDYHVDPAVETCSLTATPASDWNYYKRGTRPDTPAKFGLTIKYPAASAFTPDGFNKIMQNDFSFSTPKEELYTDVVLEYTEPGPEVNGDGTVNPKQSGGASAPKRRRFERLDITGTSGRLAINGMIKLGRTNEADAGSIYNTHNDTMFSIDGGGGMNYSNTPPYPSWDDGEANTKPDSAADLVNVGDYLYIGNEIVRVTARGDYDASNSVRYGAGDDVDLGATENFSIRVDRAQLGTTISNHADNSLVYRNPHGSPDAWGSVPFGQTEKVQSPTGQFGHIEYQSHTQGSSLENSDPPGFIIVSPYNNPQDPDDLLFGQHMPETSVTVTGVSTSNTVTTMATCRYAKTIGMKKTKVIKNTTSSDPADLRKQIVGFLSRNTQTSVKRGEFKVTGYPYTYLDIAASKITVSSNRATFTSDAFTNNAATPATSQDPREFGVLSGDIIAQMDSTGTTITRYAYISAIDTNGTYVDYGASASDTSDGVALNSSFPHRIYVPLRAGHVIRVQNTLSNVDADHLITELAYDEASGVAMTSLSTTGQYDTAVSFKPNILKAINDNAISHGKEPAEGVSTNYNEPGDWAWNGMFKATSYNAISWGKKTNDFSTPTDTINMMKEDSSLPPFDIAAGSSTGLEVNTDYIAYLNPTHSNPTEAIVVTKASVFKKDKGYLQIATIHTYEDADELVGHELNSNINPLGGNNTGIAAKPEEILTPGVFKAIDGTNSAPSYAFATDPDTGMYQYGDNQLGFTAGGTAYFLVTTNGPYAVLAVGSGTPVELSGSGQLLKDTSSIRYKDNVQDLVVDSSQIDQLRPVKFKFKGQDRLQTGLIAEEVNEIYPELINYDTEGRPESIKYNGLSVMLLAEVKKLQQELKKLKEKQ
tara:strand:- start:3148 stop:6720 length:3573 start_codon:yes stop_codon:yes gene_type:complete